MRAFETFSQLFEISGESYVVKGIPILIDDQPQFLWRGLMIDTARHYLPLETIKKTIDGLMFNKMNVLHWHITDEDSFPLDITSRPELSSSGQIAGTYSITDVKQIIIYAKTRGVRVIPEIDTPAHTQSWGRSEKLKEIIVNCDNMYNGQFDPTLDLTYEVIRDVMNQINNTFSDNYVHFGGEEINPECWDRRPSIKKWM